MPVSRAKDVMMQRDQSRVVNGLCLAGLGYVFLVTVTAPRSWERIARTQNAQQLIAMHAGVRTDVMLAESPARPQTPAIRPTYIRPEPAVAQQVVAVPVQEPLAPAPAAPTQARESTLAQLQIGGSTSMPGGVPALANGGTPMIMMQPRLPDPASLTLRHEVDRLATANSTEPSIRMAAIPKRELSTRDLPTSTTPTLQSESNIAAARPAGLWLTTPADLIADLESLQMYTGSRAWSAAVIETVQQLSRTPDPRGTEAQAALARLEALVNEMDSLSRSAPDQQVAVQWRRVAYALDRRLGIWELTPRLDESIHTASAESRVSPEQLAMAIAELDEHVGDRPEAAAWREYLMVDSLRELTQSPKQVEESHRRRLIQRVLSRFNRGNFTPGQRQFLSKGPAAKLHDELRQWATEPVDARQMLAHVERFEETLAPHDARMLAVDYRKLVNSTDPNAQEMAQRIDTHYRNANFRLSLSSDLLNRMVPEQQPKNVYVNDNMLGYPTRGWSTTYTNVGVRFIPDSNRIRVALLAQGHIDAETNTTSGPVTLHTSSDSKFVAEKEIEIGIGGIGIQPVEVTANTHPRLKWIKTQFDRVPILRGVVHNIARTKHDETQPQARELAQTKIEREVGTQINREVDTMLQKASDKFQENVLVSLEEMDLTPQVIEANSTPDRMTIRLRMAGEVQLAGHAPRPRDPDDCLMSVQMHQSLLNNLVEQLQWQGRTMSLPDLARDLCDRLNWQSDLSALQEHDDMFVTFAAIDPIRLHCDDGRMELTLSIDELRKGRESWKEFVVRVAYRPDPDSPHGVLLRDGTVRLTSNKIGARGQLALRGIFSKMFPKDRGLQVLPAKWTTDPKFNDIEIVQFDIRDGWIAIAASSNKQVAQATASGRR